MAIDDETRQKYAVKIIDKEKLNDSLSRKLNNEVYALKRLQGHANIVQIKDVIETEKQQICIVMEYCNHGELFDLITS